MNQSFSSWVPKLVLGILVIAGVWLAVALSRSELLSNPDALESYVQSKGAWGPILLIGLIVIEVVVAPLPGGIPPVIAGFLFGFVQGSLYAWIGNVIGSILAFAIGRWFRHSLVPHLADSQQLLRYSRLVRENPSLVFFAYAIPFVFPSDILSISLGVSSIRFQRFVVLMGIGYIIHVILPSLLGSIVDLSRLETIGTSIAGIVLVLIVAVFVKQWVLTPRMHKSSRQK